MIKLLWIACSIPVFIYALKYFINMELKVYGNIEPLLLLVFAFIAFAIAFSGPVAIVAYFVYNVLDDIAKTISKNYKDRKIK